MSGPCRSRRATSSARHALDGVLDLVERALARRIDLGHVEPEIAAILGLQRRIVDADVGGEHRRAAAPCPADRRRRRSVEPLRVHRRDRARLQADALAASVSDLPETRASSILSCNVCTSPAARSVAISFFSVSSTSSKLARSRRDRDHAQDRRSELSLDTSLTPPSGKAKAASAIARIEHAGLGRLAEVDVRRLELARLDDVVESGAGLDLGLGLGRFRLVGEDDLLQFALFGDDEAGVADLVVERLGVLVRHFRGLGERGRRRPGEWRSRDIRAPGSSPCGPRNSSSTPPWRARGCRPRRPAAGRDSRSRASARRPARGRRPATWAR